MLQKTILIIDGELPIRDILYRYTKGLQFEAIIVRNFLEGIAILDAKKIDLALIALSILDTQGMALLTENRKKNIEPPIVLLIGQESIESVVEAMKCGAVDYITKPIDANDLALKIQTYLPITLSWRNRLIDFLKLHCSDASLSFSDVMHHFGFSRTYGYTLFKNEVGKSYIKLLRELRLKKAKKLMQDPKLSLSEVADACGFRSLQRFSTVFSQEIGCSPSTYRKKKDIR